MKKILFLHAFLFLSAAGQANAACAPGTFAVPGTNLCSAIEPGDNSFGAPNGTVCGRAVLFAPEAVSVTVVRDESEDVCVFSVDGEMGPYQFVEPTQAANFEVTAPQWIFPNNAHLNVGQPYIFSYIGTLKDGGDALLQLSEQEGSARVREIEDTPDHVKKWELIPLSDFESVKVNGFLSIGDGSEPTLYHWQSYLLAPSGPTIFDKIMENLALILGAILTLVTIFSVSQKITINELKRRAGHFSEGSKEL